MLLRFAPVLRWAIGHLPTLFVWAGLVGVAVYGASHDWTLSVRSEKDKEKKEKLDPHDQEGHQHGPFSPYLLQQPNDVPVYVTHDPAHCEVENRPIAFKSPDAMEKAGIVAAPVGTRPMSVLVSAHGEALQDPLAVARVAPRVGGMVVRLTKQLGDPVRRGELLALLDVNEVGRAKAALLTARANYQGRQQVRDSLQMGISPERSLVEAENALRDAQVSLYSAKQALVNLGLPLPSAHDERLPDEAFARRLQFLGLSFFTRLALQMEEAAGHIATANLLPVICPLNGVVMKRFGVVGEPVAALAPLYEVGDPTRIDVFLEVRQEDMPQVALGQSMVFRLEGAPSVDPFPGTIDWVSSNVDEKTRTVRVRSRVANPAGTLKNQAFGDGTIRVGSPTALAVPQGAIHWEGCSHVVFVKQLVPDPEDKEKKVEGFMPRKVTLGLRHGGFVEVRSGLRAGEEIAVAGSHVLKCEMFKDRIGDSDE